MGETTGIAWTDHTFNPWVGCARVSPGCTHCYAEAMSHRWGHDRWGKTAERHVTSDVYWRQPLKWNRAAEAVGRPALVFCASQADVFEDRPDLVEARKRLWLLIEATPHLLWQLLTKRPQNILGMVPAHWLGADDTGLVEVRSDYRAPVRLPVGLVTPTELAQPHNAAAWPRNVWVGTTVEDQQRADERVPTLLRVPAPVRFLSCEPLLEQVDLRGLWTWCPEHDTLGGFCIQRHHPGVQRIGWVIAGGESGPGHRPLNLDHARALRDQCSEWEVPFFFKQVGGHHATAGGDLLEDERLKAFPPAAHRDVEVVIGHG